MIDFNSFDESWVEEVSKSPDLCRETLSKLQEKGMSFSLDISSLDDSDVVKIFNFVIETIRRRDAH